MTSDQILQAIQRAVAFQQAGQFGQAAALYRSVLASAPRQFEALHFLGLIEAQQGRLAEAEGLMARSLKVNAARPEAHANYARVLLELDRAEDAIKSCDKALAINPQAVDALTIRGNALRDLGRNEPALASIEKALALQPNNFVAWAARGTTLHDLYRYDEALLSHDRSLAIAPNYVDALNNRGLTLHELGRPLDALEGYNRALVANPGFAAARWNRSIVNLDLGRLADGWRDFEARWTAIMGMKMRGYPQPRWNGDHVHGTILTWADGGLGDEILFTSMVPELRPHADSIVVEVESRLVPLVARSFHDMQVIARAPDRYRGHIDVQEPMAHLGSHLRRSWDEFPKRQAYLAADPVRTAQLRERLAHDGRMVVGVSWNSRNRKFGAAKSLDLREFVPFMRLPGCRFVDLQYGDTKAEREAVLREAGVGIEHLDDIDNTNDIDGLAALICACDLVLTVSNTTAHLAGALGKPTWILMSRGNARFWYWFSNRQDSPWYPSVRLFRQPASGDWAPTLDRVRQELEALALSS